MTDTRKTAVVTGAASGIGRATALRLSQDGADVIAVDRDELGLASDELAGVRTLVADLSTDAGRDAVVEAAGAAEMLVNAAGMIRLKPILDFTLQDVRDIYAVNVEAVWDLCSRIGRIMPSGGAIVNVSSVSAKLPSTQETAVYASSKAAVLSITKSFAYAFAARNVRVNAVCPGIMDTPMQDLVIAKLADIRGVEPKQIADTRLATVPLGRSAHPAECAGLIAFLLSDEAGYMTGQAVNQTGGMVGW
jgi:NAD(P)-dependent dehydrogenase (short-subunit alcohol dehydrogenase family)